MIIFTYIMIFFYCYKCTHATGWDWFCGPGSHLIFEHFWSLFLWCLRAPDVWMSFFASVYRRNLPGDRQKALDIMLPLVNSDEQVASDIYCLVGRIYKDMFLDSHFTDTESRDHGIHW